MTLLTSFPARSPPAPHSSRGVKIFLTGVVGAVLEAVQGAILGPVLGAVLEAVLGAVLGIVLRAVRGAVLGALLVAELGLGAVLGALLGAVLGVLLGPLLGTVLGVAPTNGQPVDLRGALRAPRVFNWCPVPVSQRCPLLEGSQTSGLVSSGLEVAIFSLFSFKKKWFAALKNVMYTHQTRIEEPLHHTGLSHWDTAGYRPVA